MKPRRAPLSSPVVAITFFVAFTCLALFLSQWYEPSVMWNDPTMAFLWAGSCYVVAYSLVEFIRRVTWATFIGLLGGIMLLAFDVARHGNLLLQDSNGEASDVFLQLISSNYCAVTGADNLPCKLTVFLATSPVAVFAVVATALLASALEKFLTLRSSGPPSAATEFKRQ